MHVLFLLIAGVNCGFLSKLLCCVEPKDIEVENRGDNMGDIRSAECTPCPEPDYPVAQPPVPDSDDEEQFEDAQSTFSGDDVENPDIDDKHFADFRRLSKDVDDDPSTVADDQLNHNLTEEPSLTELTIRKSFKIPLRSSVTNDQLEIISLAREELQRAGYLDLEDSFIDRFLVANNYNKQNGVKAIIARLEWDKSNEESGLYSMGDIPCASRGFAFQKDTNINYDLADNPSLPDMMRKYIHFTKGCGGSAFHKFDNFGRPVLYVRAGMFNVKHKFDRESYLQGHILEQRFIETKILPEASERAARLKINTHVNPAQLLVIIDLKGGSLASHYHLVSDLIANAKIDMKYYPELIGKIFIINTPYVVRGIYNGFVSVFKGANTVNKVEILGENYQDRLKAFVNVDDLPCHYGGKCKCDHPGECVPYSPINNLSK